MAHDEFRSARVRTHLPVLLERSPRPAPYRQVLPQQTLIEAPAGTIPACRCRSPADGVELTGPTRPSGVAQPRSTRVTPARVRSPTSTATSTPAGR
ncbi:MULTISPECIES: hypothetical protein [Streptomyces]|uniref:hypothetical protein n=1 Tax=Streptomyces TaxID=1883 RepID=UPI0035F051FB